MNTVKTKGCASDNITVCSVQSYVKEEKGKLHVAKYSPVIIEHSPINDITIKAVPYNKIRDNAGKIIKRIDAITKGNEGLTH